MSLLSRSTGGRSVAKMAVVTVLSTIGYLFVTAVPAFAISSCTYNNQGTAVADDILTVNVDTDDHVWIIIEENNSFAGPASDDVFLVENGTSIRECVGGGNDIDSLAFVNVNGTDAGNEIVTLVNYDDGAGDAFGFENPGIPGVPDIQITVDLGNGTDTFEIEYGDVVFSDTLSAEDDDVTFTPQNNDTTELGSNNNGDWVNLEDDLPVSGAIDNDDNDANVRLVDAENLIIYGGGGIDDIDVETNAFQFNDFGGAGNQVNGPFNRGYVFNGEEDDDLAEFGVADSTFNGGPGDDEADFQDHPNAVTVDLTAGTAVGSTFVLTDVQDVVGSAFGDILTGNNLDNDIDGMGGNDDIFGLGGNDGAGTDAAGIDQGLQGGAGLDEITDGTGNDLADGGANNDIMHQEATPNGADVLDDSGGGLDVLDYGLRTSSTVINQVTNRCGNDANADGDATDVGDENDSCSGYDQLVTGTANDTLVGDASAELFQPGLGNDNVAADGGIDVLDLSDDAPTFGNGTGTAAPVTGASTINLQTGVATGPLGTDNFTGVEQFVTGGGDDVLIPTNGQIVDPAASTFDWFAGGGTDTVDASTTTIGVTVDLSNMGATTGGGFFTPACGFGGPGLANGGCTDVEHATGGSGDDTLGGSLEDNNLLGNAGNDTIIAGNGNDFLHGSDGNDVLDGQAGADTTSYRDAAAGVEIDNQAIFGGGATGGAGSDTFVTGFEIVLLSDFDDTLRAGQTFLDANLKVLGFLGNDVITGSNSVDLLRGGQGADIIRGGGGDDDERGSGGNDLLIGGNGSDLLNGGAGVDEGRGGPAFDRCRGIEIEVSC